MKLDTAWWGIILTSESLKDQNILCDLKHALRNAKRGAIYDEGEFKFTETQNEVSIELYR